MYLKKEPVIQLILNEKLLTAYATINVLKPYRIEKNKHSYI